MKSRIFIILVVLVLLTESQCINILGVFPVTFKSHHIMFQSIMTALARRGHNVTMISTFPKPRAQENYTDIDVKQCSLLPDSFTMDEGYYIRSPFTNLDPMLFGGVEMYKSVLLSDCKPMEEFLRRNDSYDLVITELFHGDVTLGFVNKFRAPHVSFCAGPIYPWAADRTGNPSNPSYIPFPHLDEEFDRFYPTFYQRLYNTICYIFAQWLYFYHSYAAQDMARKAFGSDLPRLEEIAKNTSFILSFSHFSFNIPLPLVPSVVQVAGVQINEPKSLPKDIQTFIDESDHGVIYFSMGSLLKPETIPELKRAAFLEAFNKLPHRFIWKWKGNLPDKTDKFFTSEWMPQRDILAHPKVKLFISHGGALGLNEAIYEAVPVLGIPMFADQILNLRELKAQGAAEILSYPDIDNDTVLAKITQVLEPSYSINMRKISAIFKDRPMSAMDTAIYWIEYAIRHRGARHLRSAAADMPLYQYLLLDVIAFLLAVAISVIFSIYYVLKNFRSLFVRRKRSSDLKKKT